MAIGLLSYTSTYEDGCVLFDETPRGETDQVVLSSDAYARLGSPQRVMVTVEAVPAVLGPPLSLDGDS